MSQSRHVVLVVVVVVVALAGGAQAGESLEGVGAGGALRGRLHPSGRPAAATGGAGGCRAEVSPLTLDESTQAAKEVFRCHAAVLVDVATYQANLERVVAALQCTDAPGSVPLECMPVMKADAYGHGIARLVPAVTASGATYIGVVDSWEALAARRAGWKGGLLRLRGAATSEVATLLHAHGDIGIDEWIGDAAEATELNALAGHMGQTLMAHFSFCKFMNRNAFQSVAEAMEAARRAPNLCVRGLLVHMPTADSDPEGTRERLTVFFSMVLDALPELLEIRRTHASPECRREKVIISWANSATVVRFGNADPLYADFARNITAAGLADHVRLMARPGHITYGQASGIPYTNKTALPAFGFLDGTPAPGLMPEGGFTGVPARHVPSMQSLMTYVAWSPALRRFRGLDPVTVGYGVSRVRSFVGDRQIHTSLATLPIGWADSVSREGESNFGNLDVVYNADMSEAEVYEVPSYEGGQARLLRWPGAAIMVGPWGGGMAYIAGRVSMDMTSLDVSGLVQARKMGGTNPAFFVLLGKAGGHEVTSAYANARRNADSAEPTIQISRMVEQNPDIVHIWGPLPCAGRHGGAEQGGGARVDEVLLWRFFQALLSTPVNGEAAHPPGEAGVAWEGIQAALKTMGIDNHYLRPLPDPDVDDDTEVVMI